MKVFEGKIQIRWIKLVSEIKRMIGKKCSENKVKNPCYTMKHSKVQEISYENKYAPNDSLKLSQSYSIKLMLICYITIFYSNKMQDYQTKKKSMLHSYCFIQIPTKYYKVKINYR